MPTNPYKAFSDGTTTITFADGVGGITNFPMDWRPWAPAIPAFNPTAFAGRGQYSDAVEEFTCTIRGTSASDCYDKQETLARLLDQAERWRWGENVAAVLYKVSPQGSSVSSVATPLQAAILGRAPGDKSAVRLSARWVESGRLYEIQDVKVRVWRRSPWLVSPQQAISPTVNNGTITSVGLGATLGVPGPMVILMSNYPSGVQDRGFLVFSSNDGVTRFANADPSAGVVAGWTAVNEVANFSRNTNVLRYTPAGTAESVSGSVNLTTTSTGPMFAVLANVRNNSSTTNFQLSAQVGISGGYITARTPLTYIAPFSGAAAPAWVNLGVVSLPNFPATVQFAATASAAAGSLDIGDVAIVDVTYAGTYILGYTPSANNAVVKNVLIDHALLTLPAPTTVGTLGTYPFTIEGDMVVMAKAANVHVANLITRVDTNDWRHTSGGVVTQNFFNLTRHAAYLTAV